MWLDAALSYLHFTAVFVYFAFLSIELYIVRNPVDPAAAAALRRADAWLWGAAIVVLATGAARLGFGAKGASYYTGQIAFHAKMTLFVATLALQVRPSLAIWRWARAVPGDDDRRRVRRALMAAIHLAAFIPLAAVLMARSLLVS